LLKELMNDDRAVGSASTPESRPVNTLPMSRFDVLMLSLVALTAALHLPLTSRLNLNWDEFRFLSDVYQFQRGTLTSPLQTIHVYLFSWLPGVGQNEIDQIVVARFIYYLLLLGSCGFVYLTATRFLTRAGALFAVLALLSYSDVIAHGTSFRFDGLSVFLLLGALTLLVRKPMVPAATVAAGFLTAVSLMVTLKSGFYLPTFLLVLGIASPGSWKKAALQALFFVAAMVSFFALLFVLHSAILQSPSTADSVERMQWVVGTGIGFADLFPRSNYLVLTIVVNPGVWLLVVTGVALVLRSALRGERSREALLVLAILAPLASLAVYRNAFPYYYVFLMPSAVIVAGVAFDRLGSGRRWQERARAALVGIIAGGFAFHYSDRLADETHVQRELVEAVHEMFPKPVPYVDRNSMIASFPKVGFFMSTWGFERYHARGVPIFRDLLSEAAPMFLIANHPALEIHSNVAEVHPYRLLDEDLRVLRENFVRHWGPVHAAGKTFVATNVEEVELEILIPGVYEVLSLAPVYINEVRHDPGDAVILSRGMIVVLGGNEGQEVTLRIGRELYRPSTEFPDGAIYRGF
jgi:hypothetical protein